MDFTVGSEFAASNRDKAPAVIEIREVYAWDYSLGVDGVSVKLQSLVLIDVNCVSLLYLESEQSSGGLYFWNTELFYADPHDDCGMRH